MPTITTLEPQQHDPERLNLYLDGDFALGLSRLVVAAHHLTVGRVLEAAEIEDLQQDDAVERAHNAALNFLSFRPRSRRELEDYFRRKKVPPETVGAVVERLERVGLLDDREFARFWVENRQTFRPRGSRALRVEMRQKGLAGEIIDDTLATITDEEVPAYEAARKKLRSVQGLEEREFFRKLVSFLQRRGFPYEVAATVTRRLWAEIHP